MTPRMAPVQGIPMLSIIFVLVVVFVLVKLLSSRGGRSFAAGLGALVAIGFVLLLLVRHSRVDHAVVQFQQQAQQFAREQQMHAKAIAREANEQARSRTHAGKPRTISPSPPAPLPPPPAPATAAAAPSRRPEPGIVQALAIAVRRACLEWADSVINPPQPAKSEAAPAAVVGYDPAAERPPAWVSAPAKLDGDVYMMGARSVPT